MSKPDVYERKMVEVLTPELKRLVKDYFTRHQFVMTDDGAKFSKMYQLVAEPTRQRFQGHLKCHGYQYPSCLVDGDRLLIAHSVNKEDIAVGIVDTTEI